MEPFTTELAWLPRQLNCFQQHPSTQGEQTGLLHKTLIDATQLRSKQNSPTASTASGTPPGYCREAHSRKVLMLPAHAIVTMAPGSHGQIGRLVRAESCGATAAFERSSLTTPQALGRPSSDHSKRWRRSCDLTNAQLLSGDQEVSSSSCPLLYFALPPPQLWKQVCGCFHSSQPAQGPVCFPPLASALLRDPRTRRPPLQHLHVGLVIGKNSRLAASNWQAQSPTCTGLATSILDAGLASAALQLQLHPFCLQGHVMSDPKRSALFQEVGMSNCPP